MFKNLTRETACMQLRIGQKSDELLATETFRDISTERFLY